MDERKTPENLALSLFGDDAPEVRVELDPDAPKRDRRKPERMDGGDTNCACE